MSRTVVVWAGSWGGCEEMGLTASCLAGHSRSCAGPGGAAMTTMIKQGQQKRGSRAQAVGRAPRRRQRGHAPGVIAAPCGSDPLPIRRTRLGKHLGGGMASLELPQRSPTQDREPGRLVRVANATGAVQLAACNGAGATRRRSYAQNHPALSRRPGPVSSHGRHHDRSGNA